ncbi:MAG: hypothetical protein Q7T19_15160 [Caulobacter sp.]|nr:hypothetical protein [Caulobacter sp.]
MSRFRVLLILIVVLTAGWAQSAAAEVRVTFYSHGWAVGSGGETYFPHAYIRIEGSTADGPPVDRTFGFSAENLSTAVKNLPGLVQPANPRFPGASVAHFWLVISDEQYRTLMARIAWWRTPDGSLYNLRSRNCIDFVADMASTLGLEPGQTRTWKPNVFMADTMKRNPGRVVVSVGLAATRAPPSVPAGAAAAANR